MSMDNAGFWFPLDRLGRMVLQIPETTRYLALTKQEQLIARQRAGWPLSELKQLRVVVREDVN